MKTLVRLCLLIWIVTIVSCGPGPQPPTVPSDGGTTPATPPETRTGGSTVEPATTVGTTFGDDLAFLKEHTEVTVLSDDAGQAKVAVVGAMQGRVMTSTKETGLLSIWILGMLAASDGVTVVIPFVEGPEEDLGPIVNDTYFDKVPGDRLVVKDGTIFFSGDGQCRSKIGLSPQRSKPVLGSYDSVSNVLTVVQTSQPAGVVDYVNSMWELQKHPYSGDAVNSYNDGPMAPGEEQLGNFYELETSSPAAALGPGESIEHRHRTVHFQGAEQDLSPIAVPPPACRISNTVSPTSTSTSTRGPRPASNTSIRK